MTSWSLEPMDITKCFHPWDSPSKPLLQPHQRLLVRGELSAFTYVLSNWKHVVFDWVKVSDLAMREQYFCCHWGKKTVPLLASTSLWKSYWEFQWSAAKCNFKTWNWKLWCCTEAKVCVCVYIYIYIKKSVTVFQIQTCKICQVKEGNDGDNF